MNTDQKFDLLMLLLKRDRPRQCIVFTRTKRGADRLADRLHRSINGVSAIHGDLPQTTRDRVMRGFRSGQISVLVATDVVGRGIDVEGISHVINYDMPDDPENYVHRIGRTGRMGKDGVAYLFVCPDQGEPLTAIENLINRVIPPLELEGFAIRDRRVEPAARELFNTAATRSPILAALVNEHDCETILTRPSASKSPRAPSRSSSAPLGPASGRRTKPGRNGPSVGRLACQIVRAGQVTGHPATLHPASVRPAGARFRSEIVDQLVTHAMRARHHPRRSRHRRSRQPGPRSLRFGRCLDRQRGSCGPTAQRIAGPPPGLSSRLRRSRRRNQDERGRGADSNTPERTHAARADRDRADLLDPSLRSRPGRRRGRRRPGSARPP